MPVFKDLRLHPFRLMLALMYASASYATCPHRPLAAVASWSRAFSQVSGASGQLGSAIFCLGAVTIAATIGWTAATLGLAAGFQEPCIKS